VHAVNCNKEQQQRIAAKNGSKLAKISKAKVNSRVIAGIKQWLPGGWDARFADVDADRMC
jgi:hypothetical protein